jgi:hypothetical protein
MNFSLGRCNVNTAQTILLIIVFMSLADNARSVCVLTFPKAAMLSDRAFADSDDAFSALLRDGAEAVLVLDARASLARCHHC